jgi:hypothetical protein
LIEDRNIFAKSLNKPTINALTLKTTEKQVIQIFTPHMRSYSKAIFIADICISEQSNAKNNHILCGKNRP